MNIKIIAEGVEEFEESAMLNQLDCEMAQVYYYSRPVDELQMLELLLRQKDPCPASP